jgi:diguanylate cyclase (GGDEF)-like protein/PAS domain S-box-containing protein
MSDKPGASSTAALAAAQDRQIRESAFDAILTIGPDGTITSLNTGAERMLGYRWQAVVGRHVRMLAAEPLAADAEQLRELERAGGCVQRELLVRDARGSTLVVEARVMRSESPETGFVVVARDLTRVKTVEDELRLSDAAITRFGAEQSALRRVAAAIAQGASPAQVFELVAHEAAALHGVERGTLIRFKGRRSATIVGSWELGGAGDAELPSRPFALRRDSSVRRVLRSSATARLDDSDPASEPPEASIAAPVHLESALWGALAISTSRTRGLTRDAEERLSRFADLVAPAVVEAEARDALERRAAEQLALATLGEQALRSADIEELLAGAARIVATTLRVERVMVLELLPDHREVIVRARSGRSVRGGGTTRIPIGEGTQLARSLSAEAPVVVDDARTDERFEPSPSADPGSGSSIIVSIRLHDGPWGALAAVSRRPGHFGSSGPPFLHGVAQVLASAIERRQGEDHIRFQAMHDPLTGIANRTLLTDRLEIALGRARRVGRSVAVMILDIDRFKAVNDAIGRAQSDLLLVAVARRLSDVVRLGDTAARIGGDEFAVLYEEVSGEREAAELADRLVESVRLPFAIGDEVSVTASVGVVLRGGADSAEGALRDAHTATYRAKTTGRDRFEVFDESMRTRLIERSRIVSELRRAIEGDELVVYYQPIVSLADGALNGVEALVRWRHPERGLIGPGSFVSVAEETGQIASLGRKVLAHACRDAASWNERANGGPPLRVSVNLSALQIADDTIVDDVLSMIDEWSLPTGQLGLEITESILLDDNRTHLARLEAFRVAGIRIILDDFGTGYSSLSYLRRFPLDVLKLDRSFVTGIGGDPGAAAIVGAVTRMAHTLQLAVVAEGVERTSELRTLERLGCELAQGYLFARPMSFDRLARLQGAPMPWIARERTRPQPPV